MFLELGRFYWLGRKWIGWLDEDLLAGFGCLSPVPQKTRDGWGTRPMSEIQPLNETKKA
jgi:hypothetical protein